MVIRVSKKRKCQLSECGQVLKYQSGVQTIYKFNCGNGHFKGETNRRCMACERESYKKDLEFYWEKESVKDKHPSWKNAHIRGLARGWYKKYITNCMNCGYNKHVEVCHIKAIKDFDSKASILQVNSPENIAILCPNCHWEFDNNLLKHNKSWRIPGDYPPIFDAEFDTLDNYEIIGRFVYTPTKGKRKKPTIREFRAYDYPPNKEFFRLVWSKSVVELSKDFGVSDSAIGKACKKNKIPKPPRGYWKMDEISRAKVYNEAKIEFEKVHGSIDSPS